MFLKMKDKVGVHYRRRFEDILKFRLKESSFIQTVLGPRQVGKTTGVLNVLESSFDSADYDYYSCGD